MKRIAVSVVLVSLIGSGCSDKEQAKNQSFELCFSSQSVDSGKGIILHVDLFTEGDRTVRVDRGGDGYSQVGVSDDRDTGSTVGTAQIILTAKLKSEGNTVLFEKESEIKTNSGRGRGLSSGTVDPDLKLSDLASFVVKPGNYTYGEEILLGTVEGDKWILTVK